MSHREEDRGQHYIECARCINYSTFYCNDCHQRMCEQHKDIHLKKEKHTKHAVVLYQERIQELPTEKCLIHPKRYLEIYCNECQLPVCSECFTIDHNGHQVVDLEVVYNECLQQRQIELIKLRDTILPQSVEKLNSWRGRVETVKEDIAKIRLYMKTSAEKIKAAVDSTLAENNSKLDKMEISILLDMSIEEQEMEQYISNLQEHIKMYESRTPLTNPSDVFRFSEKIAGIPSMEIPNTTEPVLPEFITGIIAKQEIRKQFGKIRQCDPKTQKGVEKQISPTSQPSHLRVRHNPLKIMETQMPKLRKVHHLSSSPSGEVWASDGQGNLVQSDLQGNLQQEFPTDMSITRVFHTINTNGELLYTNKNTRTVYKVSRNMTTTALINTGGWEPGTIYSSHFNRDILVGMSKNKKSRVVRYSKEGKRLQIIQKDEKGQDLYRSIRCISENINGDICVSDYQASTVVVVTRSGQPRFSYSGRQLQRRFSPLGICTDVVGHILVCQSASLETRFPTKIKVNIHLLDKNGQFMTFLHTSIENPCSVCVDDKQNLWVGCRDNPTITVYKYLEKIDK